TARHAPVLLGDSRSGNARAGKAALGLGVSPYALVNVCTKSPDQALANDRVLPLHSVEQGGLQAFLAHSPEVVLDPVDQSDGDHLGVSSEIVRRRGYVAFFPAHPEIGSHPADDGPRVVAQVAARATQQRHNVAAPAAGHRYSREPPPRGAEFGP